MKNYMPSYRAHNPQSHRNRHLKRNYGIDVQEYDRMLSDQDGSCAICETDITGVGEGAVDHDHESGVVRGLLCRKCNSGRPIVTGKQIGRAHV